jgi:dipeptidyl-peptidase-4
VSTSTRESFPRTIARTRNFTRGVPRALHLDRTGQRLLFLRSNDGSDPVGRLWSMDTRSGEETLVADPAALLHDAHEELTAEERARRERLREAAAGIVSFATDEDTSLAVFALSSRLWVADLSTGEVRELPAVGAVLDPRPDPTGRWVAYAADGGLHVVSVDGSESRTVAEPDGPDVAWGVAEFVAAEEMSRYRGYWWSPDGASLLATRVDDAPVQVWHIADPANPGTAPMAVRYPQAGTDNADVTVHVLGLDGSRVEVPWDRAAYPYVITASWGKVAPLLTVMTRDQRTAVTYTVDPSTGATTLRDETSDPVWVDVVTGVPALLTDGRLVSTAELDGTRRLTLDGTPVTPAGLQVSAVLDVSDGAVLLAGTDEPTEHHVWLVDLAGGELRRLSEPGTYASGLHAGGTVALATRRLEQPGTVVTVQRPDTEAHPVRSHAETPPFSPDVRMLTVGEHDLRVGVLLPRDHVPGTALPVLMDPYGGPQHQEVIRVHDMWLEPQWWADQGFAVVVADGRGTGSRGPEWDRAVRDDLAEVSLNDQVAALEGVAKELPDLDLSRVAIRGWSYGGYLAGLAVLRRPDVFAAAVAGAPVTDMALYDTFYTERYLGDPRTAADVYARHSLIEDAAKLERPLLLIHGLADDNVVVAHTLRLSAALLAAGRPHDVLPLTGVTHMASQEEVAENLLLLQLHWLRRALGVSAPA